MKLFLIQQLKYFNVPGYRTRNAWSKEAWNMIVDNINQKFGLSLDVVKVKQKELDHKKDFCTVKDLAGESGARNCGVLVYTCVLQRNSPFKTLDAWRMSDAKLAEDFAEEQEGRQQLQSRG
ncbi:hypothetical protein ZWY2020_029662 [Hordeum vulgare]|nr:hypothetical protein ZWY2020_029662 [Hordeum vulgare]